MNIYFLISKPTLISFKTFKNFTFKPKLFFLLMKNDYIFKSNNVKYSKYFIIRYIL